MHDVPYVQSDSVGPEVTAMMTAICIHVKRLLKPSPVGVQVLAGANKQAMAVAKAAGGWWVMAVAKAAGGWWVIAKAAGGWWVMAIAKAAG